MPRSPLATAPACFEIFERSIAGALATGALDGACLTLEQRLTDKSMLDSLFAANRKAKLWDQFHALSKQVQEEAQEDFHTLFGKAFLKAYDEQVQKLAEQSRKVASIGRSARRRIKA